MLFEAHGDKEYLPITVGQHLPALLTERDWAASQSSLRSSRTAKTPNHSSRTECVCSASSLRGRTDEKLAITQSISGTGALRIGTAFLARFYPGAKTIYLPSPTWGNHIPIAKDSGLEVKHYKWVTSRRRARLEGC